MKLAMSNIAWEPTERRDVYELLRRNGFAGIEVAPALALPLETDPFEPSDEGVAAFRSECMEFGLQPVSMQSLLFGVSGAELFGDADAQNKLTHAMLRAISLAGRLGIANLVFGAPRNRVYPESIGARKARSHALAFFRALGALADAAGMVFAIEPNPKVYGTNFLTTVEAAADFVAVADCPGIALNYDIGALLTNGEEGQAGSLYRRAGGRVSHVHISEPGLAPAPARVEQLAAIVRELVDCGYRGWFSIEMRRPEQNTLAVIQSHIERVVQVRDEIGKLLDA